MLTQYSITIYVSPWLCDVFSGYKGQNLDMKSKENDQGFQPMICVFDILLLNGEVLSNKTLKERKKLLSQVFTPVKGRIILSEFREARTK